ncbi:hypothetical protein A2690_01155 [Candidatus Roizmanbacteria bacterium RIFCSPHIGHO2_01_FULL_39_12b]|uniref:Glycosyltransferase 2-like domain-containing protein n=1 Tax=Candidatus Roizmanbacteria bacterium RIFCSPHIGHO2_01_FULL_39_12b TaxID=1802030 RepID=A0A1F7GC39_9BACT|nr:MAG: hypothetical protein A2690_01155 [Candidatus Roizmanbacteria bacterium RIFCSPHIGHO2_01_FULL_39_12b]
MLTVLIITLNARELIEETLECVLRITKDIIIVDNGSTDNTLDIARKYHAKILNYSGRNLGKQRILGLKNVKTEWILVLDADERLSKELQNEIKEILSKKTKYDGFFIPYQNHFLGKPINYGGEDYSMIRLFKKDKIVISPDLVHEGFSIPNGNIGKLEGKILHYSYRSLSQTFSKFHDYALREAQQKFVKKERSNLKKIFMYPPHMFWARFIKDKGYKDSAFRIPLDLGFAYMEFMTYLILAFKNLRTYYHL